MKKTLLSMLVVVSLAVMLMLGFAPQDDPVQSEINKLSQEVAQLGLRVDRLEHAAGQAPASQTSGASASGSTGSATPTRTMTLVSISKFTDAGDHSQEIAQLQRKSSALMNTVNAHADQKEYDSGQQLYAAHVSGGVRGWGSAVGGSVATSNVGAVERQVMGEQDMENRYATEHAITEKKIQDLQNHDNEPRQIIVGHTDNGKMVITLETKTDLSDSISNIPIGATVTWLGERVSADTTSESWTITSLTQVK